METKLTIQQVAEKTGLSVHTLRYYERNGLLESVNRAANGHRRYNESDVIRVKFLTRLRLTGMPIRQMQKLARLFYEHPEAISDRRAILEEHQHNVQQHIQELQQNLAAIQQKIQFYKELENQANPDPTTIFDDRMLCFVKESSCLAEVDVSDSLEQPQRRQSSNSRVSTTTS